MTGQDIIDNAGHGPLEDSDGTKIHYFMNVDAKTAGGNAGSTAVLQSYLITAADMPRFCFTFSYTMEVLLEKKTFEFAK